jgi:hypothetical protein
VGDDDDDKGWRRRVGVSVRIQGSACWCFMRR